MGSVSGRYAGVEAGERVAARRQRLLDAALDIVGTEGWQSATVRSICGRARLTPRYFYESFADRDALLLALFDQVAQEGATVALRAVLEATDDARAKARAAIGAFVELVADDPRKAHVLFVEAVGSEVLARRRAGTLRMYARLVAEQGRTFYGAAHGPDPVVETTALMLAGGLSETLLAWIDGTLAVARQQLVEDCAELFVAAGEAAVRIAARRPAPTAL